MAHYYISGVVDTLTIANQSCFQIMEGVNKQQTCIALVPFNPRHKDGWTLGRTDAKMICDALNKMEDE